MKRKYRLLKKNDFQKTLKNNRKKIYSKNFIFYFEKSNYKNIRIGIITPKKFFKKATDRNYYKRVITNSINQSFDLVELPNFNCIFYCKKELAAEKVDFKKLKSEVQSIIFNLKNK